MAILKKEIEFAKELDDVFALLVGIVADAKAKKPLSEIASGSVAKLIDAIGGIDQVPVELKASRKVSLDTGLLRVSEIVDLLA